MTRATPYLIALVLALLLPAAASADWLPIEEVGNIEESDQDIRMDANDRGDAVLIWSDTRGIQVSVSKRGAAFRPPLKVPGSAMASGAQVDLNEDGRAIVWWREFVEGKGIRYKLVGLKVDGGLGKPRVVTPTTPYVSLDLVIGPGGRFAVVYSTGERARPVYARVAPPSGKLGRRFTLSSGSIQPSDLWYLGNRPMIAYRQASDDYGRLRERPIGSGSPRVIATVPKNGTVVLDTASNGVQVALWTGRDTEGPPRPVVASVRKPHGVFGKGSTLQTRVPPQVMTAAVARNGAAIVAWREWNESTTEDGPSPTPGITPGAVVYSFHPAGGSFGSIQTFRPEPENRVVERLSADVASSGLAALVMDGGRFVGIERRLYAAMIDDGKAPSVTPMTDFDSPLFRLDRIEIDEKERTAFGWIDRARVLARRGTW